VGSICLKKNTVLLEEGHSDDTLYVVSSGSLEVIKPTGGGDVITLQVLHAGDMAGILGFVDGVPHSAAIRALRRCELIVLDRKTLEQLLKKDPEIVYQVMRSIVQLVGDLVGGLDVEVGGLAAVVGDGVEHALVRLGVVLRDRLGHVGDPGAELVTHCGVLLGLVLDGSCGGCLIRCSYCVLYQALRGMSTMLREIVSAAQMDLLSAGVQPLAGEPEIGARQHGHAEHLAPFHDQAGNPAERIPIRWQDYLSLLDWSGRALHPGKRGRIPGPLPPILERLNLGDEAWLREMRHYGKWYFRAVGSIQSLERYCQHLGQQWLRGAPRPGPGA